MSDQLTKQQEATKTLGTNIRNEQHDKFKKLKKVVPIGVFVFMTLYVASNFGLYAMTKSSGRTMTQTSVKAPVVQPIQQLRPDVDYVIVPLCGAESWSNPVSIPVRQSVRPAWSMEVLRIQNLTSKGWILQDAGDQRGAISAVRYCTTQPAHAEMRMPLTWSTF